MVKQKDNENKWLTLLVIFLISAATISAIFYFTPEEPIIEPIIEEINVLSSTCGKPFTTLRTNYINDSVYTISGTFSVAADYNVGLTGGYTNINFNGLCDDSINNYLSSTKVSSVQENQLICIDKLSIMIINENSVEQNAECIRWK